jgi:hypothetical protein
VGLLEAAHAVDVELLEVVEEHVEEHGVGNRVQKVVRDL